MLYEPARAQAALGAYELPDPRLTPLHTGNINETYSVEAGSGRYILQRLNPIFAAAIHVDIDRVTRHLRALGMDTPLLVPTRDAALWLQDATGGVWRLLTYVEGVVHSHAPNGDLVEQAGALLGRFHRALTDYHTPFAAPRLGVHDTPRHLDGLRAALQTHRTHRAYPALAPVAHAILAASAGLPPLLGLPARVVHGDPKLNNIVFTPEGHARALIDLDTLNRLPVAVELGDAMRSWCNPQGENADATRFDVDYFRAAMRGYADSTDGLLQAAEIASLTCAVQTIALELAARFARDTLEESYFGWDRSRYEFAWEHNLRRARSQLSLARSYAAQQAAASAVLAELFA